MKMSKVSTERMTELYNEYRAHLDRGLTETEALAEMNYLHVITFARLKKRIKIESLKGAKDSTGEG